MSKHKAEWIELNKFIDSDYGEDLKRYKKPLTQEEFDKLRVENSFEMISKKLESLANTEKAHTKYKSVYLVIKNWMRRD